MSVTKEIKCSKCNSFIHDTKMCGVWKDKNYCMTDKKYKIDCDCLNCETKCPYTNAVINDLTKIHLEKRNGTRCLYCNEFLVRHLDVMICLWNHSKPPCEYCNLPINIFNNVCANYHTRFDHICSECNLPKRYKHLHDGQKCKNCNFLLNFGSCSFGCVDAGTVCIHCNGNQVVKNICLLCGKDNTGHLTKRAFKNELK